MIPAFWVAVAGLCVSLICLIVIPFAGIFFFDRIESYVYKHLMKDIETNNLVVFLLILWVFVAIVAGAQFASLFQFFQSSVTNIFALSCSMSMAFCICYKFAA